MTNAERTARNDVIRELLERLDRHSPSERGHAERVAVYSVAMAEQMGLSDEALEDIRVAALLHDVGKVSLDASLLAKMGRLTDEEIGALRRHAHLAASVLESIDWLEPSLPAIRHHHERWDGTGYPDGLFGPDIPLGARLIGLAETFDVLAMGLHRQAVDEEAALNEIRACAGTQFDPRAVGAFLIVQPLIQPMA